MPLSAVVISAEVIRRGFPRCADPDAWAEAFTKAFAKFPQFNFKGAACILAMAGTESPGLTLLDSSGYTSTERIRTLFGSRAGANPENLVDNPKALLDQAYERTGGPMARGLGVINLTGLANHEAFAKAMGLELGAARLYMATIPGAAMTAPWYLDHLRGTDEANAGDMMSVLALVFGKSRTDLQAIWSFIGGDRQMRDYEFFKNLLGA
jgi:predicted chitinase